MKLLTRTEASAYLSLSVTAARKILDKLPCVDFGSGRGKGKRWLMSDLDAYIMSIRKRQPEAQKQYKPSSIANLTPDTFLHLVNGGNLQ